MRYLSLLTLAAAVATSCSADAPTATNQQQPWVPATTAPESLVQAIEIIYNDKVHSVNERVEAFGKLLTPDFQFCFQQVDWDSAGVRCWGYQQEIEATRCIFQKQANGRFYSFRLDIHFSPATDLDPPDPARPGWKEVFASSVLFEVLLDPNNGWVVNGGQAKFRAYLLGDRWVIGEWIDLPRPRMAGGTPAVKPWTWGRIKLLACH